MNVIGSGRDRGQSQRTHQEQRGYRRSGPETVGDGTGPPSAGRSRPREREQPQEPQGRAGEYVRGEREDGPAGRGDHDQCRDRPGHRAPECGRRTPSGAVGGCAISLAHGSCDRPGEGYGQRREDGEHEDEPEADPLGQPGRGRDKYELRRCRGQSEGTQGPSAAPGLHEGGDCGCSAHGHDSEAKPAQRGERRYRPQAIGGQLTQCGQSEQPGSEHQGPAPPEAGQHPAH